jgi:hypothetical protein
LRHQRVRGQVVLGHVAAIWSLVQSISGLILSRPSASVVSISKRGSRRGSRLEALRPVIEASNPASARASGITLRISQQPSGS